MQDETPSDALKKLRGRAGLTGGQISANLGYASPSWYFNWESNAKQNGRKFPRETITQLMSVFVGRGTPPIVEDEMLRLIRDGDVAKAPLPLPRSIEGRKDTGLSIAYEIIEGAMVAGPRDLGKSPLTAVSDYPIEHQFVVAVRADKSNTFPPGAFLLCCAPYEFSAALLPHRRVILKEFLTRDGWFVPTVHLLGSRPITDVIGVVIASWRVE